MRNKSAWILATILVANFVGQFDFFVVNVAAPQIQADLGAAPSELELVVAAYALTYAAGLITGGRMGDLFGRRRVFMIGLAAFAVTSAGCGFAGSPRSLIAARAFQGLAGAVMLPQVLALINTLIPEAQRRKAMGWFGVASGLGSIGGQAVGGWLIHVSPWGLGWRSVFLVNVPILVAAWLAAAVLLPSAPQDPSVSTDSDSSPARVDGLGALGLFFGMGLLIAAVTGLQHGHGEFATLGILAGLGALAATVTLEARRVRSGKPVTIDPQLFRIRSLRQGSVASGAFMTYFASFMFVLTLVLQAFCGLDPLHAGLIFLPSGATFMLASLAAPRLKIPLRAQLLTGCGITLAGLAIALTAAWTSQPPSALPMWLCVAVTLTGWGNGLVLPSLIGLSMKEVPARRAGMASGAVTTVQQFASAFGVAALGGIFLAGDSAQHGLLSTVSLQMLLLGATMLACWRATSAQTARV